MNDAKCAKSAVNSQWLAMIVMLAGLDAALRKTISHASESSANGGSVAKCGAALLNSGPFASASKHWLGIPGVMA
ncbi:hypothetical protein CPter291_0289 [Collimonas pratensis]|uniref:Uncharacterized protein n=1 Tax=Collimonas pratensis TaxID=279113 RepID=A0ABM5Z0S5_9BURK|nr:hypothetical protein CPter291_0289 [Collimonas pratensis]